MSLLASGKVNYRARIERAAYLASRYPFASEILGFYRDVAGFQQEFAEQLPHLWGKHPVVAANGEFRSDLNIPLLLDPFRKFLGVIEKRGPDPLAARARQFRLQGETLWKEALSGFWETGLVETRRESSEGATAAPEPLQEFLPRAFLQPYAEFVTSAMLPSALPLPSCRCPRCHSLPLLGVLRPEGDGGKRFLLCSFCSQEWEFRRIFCAKCEEEAEQELPVYLAEEWPHIRMETCESCKHFLRTIDLTKDGNAVPLVDDLAAIPLSLWAAENGYKRIQGNLLGT